MWEGLGYYQRARQVHKTAKLLCSKGKEIPSSLAELRNLPGIGPYTAAAVASFAFHQKAAAVDANVLRVIARFFGIEGNIQKEHIESLTWNFLPDEEPWIVMEALIELGAIICQKRPLCDVCPLRLSCIAHIQKKAEVIPPVKRRQEMYRWHKYVAVLLYQEEVLLEQRGKGKVLEGLMEFPSFPYDTMVDLEEVIYRELSLAVIWKENLPQQKYCYTKHRVLLSPIIFHVIEKKEVEGRVWTKCADLQRLPFSSGHKRVLLSAFRSGQSQMFTSKAP